MRSGWADFTQVSRQSSQAVTFAPAGQSVVMGYPEKFREININLRLAWFQHLDG